MNLPARRKGPIWMVVATPQGIAEASIIAGRLESVGIPCLIHREPVGAALGLSIGLGQVRVLVPEKFYDVAMATLEPDETIPWLDDGQEADEETEEGDDDMTDHDQY